ncbi:hypothetical protein D3M79_09130 [Rodentibacter pneumotropicus]|uniref:Lipoprotein n=1 Tax=Rodentibacter pneumotropicus TaxID=758 RepID=A0A4S2P784_9PAST|nr:hypothetical protein [Rodentibacter pneumotropicus]TGZ98453.1 hypothetical protein D3M79_09130 [Rodentibacter pneumotropicus]TGZ98849.1 hypothetical protein D3M74_10275 [Rodentibacter pneumotropicus]THA04477.1 hypothetical protein D3M77_10840 [Rodentibacter pneumotropicus]THA11169.1 hypothetical protein D3M76_11545 [Rodentibacter pneumotropicus]
MRKALCIFTLLILLSGCSLILEPLFPHMYFQCTTTFLGKCKHKKPEETMYWGIRDPHYNVTAKIDSEEWHAQVDKKTQKKKSIFELCKADPKTGESLVGKTKSEVYSCLEQHGLYRYSSKTD